ncbi:hypothetical protein CLV67_104377 [Actinoplanes italicus]|uniref:Uncharacterized protein n=1 Tax=Actinoplanes italicus TaxID=113567 RepID=A0A2T0KHD0_9ACTN|nr:hypothetical protein CLV67_104377 [Actinoplanes italicus]
MSRKKKTTPPEHPWLLAAAVTGAISGATRALVAWLIERF